MLRAPVWKSVSCPQEYDLTPSSEGACMSCCHRRYALELGKASGYRRGRQLRSWSSESCGNGGGLESWADSGGIGGAVGVANVDGDGVDASGSVWTTSLYSEVRIGVSCGSSD